MPEPSAVTPSLHVPGARRLTADPGLSPPDYAAVSAPYRMTPGEGPVGVMLAVLAASDMGALFQFLASAGTAARHAALFAGLSEASMLGSGILAGVSAVQYVHTAARHRSERKAEGLRTRREVIRAARRHPGRYVDPRRLDADLREILESAQRNADAIRASQASAAGVLPADAVRELDTLEWDLASSLSRVQVIRRGRGDRPVPGEQVMRLDDARVTDGLLAGVAYQAYVADRSGAQEPAVHAADPAERTQEHAGPPDAGPGQGKPGSPLARMQTALAAALAAPSGGPAASPGTGPRPGQAGSAGRVRRQAPGRGPRG